MIRRLFVILFVATALIPTAYAKDDVIVFINDDRLSGELKKMERAKIHFDTDSSSTTPYDWDDIKALTTHQMIDVEMSDGKRHYGTISPTDRDKVMQIKTDEGVIEIMHSEVVRMKPVDEQFWGRFEGYLNLGFSFTKSSDVAQLSFGTGLSYLGEVYSAKADHSSIVTTQESDEATQRHDFKFDGRKFFAPRWFMSLLNGLSHNSELGIDFRLTLGFGPGVNIIQTNHNILGAIISANVNQEWLAGANDKETSGEGDFTLTYDLFNMDKPDVSLSILASVKPSFTIRGRIRANGDAKLSWEVIDDFTWDQSLFIDYDRKPQSVGAAKADYGFITGVGWSFD